MFPGSTAGPGAYALVGMGTAFAGIVRTPLTSVIMIFEVTRDYTIIVPLMISNLIAYFISYKLQREPIYEALAHQEGLHLPGPETRSPSKSHVSSVMRPAPVPFSPQETVGAALAQMTAGTLAAWPVADAQGLVGMIRRDDLETALADGSGGAKLATIVAPIDSEGSNIPHVHPDHGLHLALDRIGSSGLQVVPVVSRANIRDLLGVIVLDDILRAYGVAPVFDGRNDSNVHTEPGRHVEHSVIEEED